MAQESTNPGSEISLVEKGNADRTAMHADVFNEVIKAINKLLKVEIKPTGKGEWKVADANIVLDLTKAVGLEEIFTDDTSAFAPGSGSGEVQNPTSIMLDEDLFEVFADGTTAVIKLRTETCGDIDGGSA